MQDTVSWATSGIYKWWKNPHLPAVVYIPSISSSWAHHPGIYQLAGQATRLQLSEACNYICDTWPSNPLWPSSSQSAFMSSIHTNNDVEGWHHILNAHSSKSNLPLYVLIQLLHEEAITTSIEVPLISQRKPKWSQRMKHRQVQGHVFKLWDIYNAGQKYKSTAERFFRSNNNSVKINHCQLIAANTMVLSKTPYPSKDVYLEKVIWNKWVLDFVWTHTYQLISMMGSLTCSLK